jgi:hypothetical protein
MSDPVEFYDLQEDPEEMNNRVLDPDYADVIAERVALIETLIAEEVPAETA